MDRMASLVCLSFRMNKFNYDCINLPLNLIKLFIPYSFF